MICSKQSVADFGLRRGAHAYNDVAHLPRSQELSGLRLWVLQHEYQGKRTVHTATLCICNSKADGAGPANHDADFFHGVALAAAGARDCIPDLDGTIADGYKTDDPLNALRDVAA